MREQYPVLILFCKKLSTFSTEKKPLAKARKSTENLWADEDFKILKKRKMEMSMKEQEVRIDLTMKKAALTVAQTELANAQTELAKLQAEEFRQR